MKKLILFAALIGASFTTAQAQDLMQQKTNPKVEHRVTQETDMLKKELSLTKEQEGIVKERLHGFALERYKILNSGESKAELHKQVDILEAKKMNEMREILNPEQYEHLEKIKEVSQDGVQKKSSNPTRLKSKTMSRK